MSRKSLQRNERPWCHARPLRILGIERLESRRLLAADFGDAPAPYPTTLARGGASHEAVGLTLGAARDAEADGQPSMLSDGDGADDDGVAIGAVQVGSFGSLLTVNVQGSTGMLDAWIDFNGDGTWGGPGEQIFDSHSVSVGDNVLMFDVPPTAVTGTVQTRFRLSTIGNLGVGGWAPDGEVEDYQITIAGPASASGVFFPQTVIGTGGDGSHRVETSDVDRDGDLDVVSASFADDTIRWYENNGSQDFLPRIISSVADEARDVAVADLDGDGDIDVLSASSGDDTIAWHENDGSQNFTTRTISTEVDGAIAVLAADMDGDGDMDVIAASERGGAVIWYENDGSQNFAAETLADSTDRVRGIEVVDIDRDGDMDVLGSVGDEILLIRNGSNQLFYPAISIFTDVGARPQGLTAADIDGDGDTDVAVALSWSDMIVWLENDGTQNFTPRTISGSATTSNNPVSVEVSDIDGDGDLDLVSGSSSSRISWFINDGNQNFTHRAISALVAGSPDVAVGDVDGDGDLDVLSASSYDDKVAWYENGLVGDLGDAPPPYPTELIWGGPAHVGVGPHLGASRDIDTDGQPTPAADGDDLDVDGDDEDGVTLGAIQVGDSQATLTVNVQGGSGKLDAWIDLDGDRTWDGPSDQIFDSVDVAPGDNQLEFSVPITATSGLSQARFRLSTAGDLDVGGVAYDGEVEDYQVTIAPLAPDLFAAQAIITSSVVEPSSVFAADIDGDGDMDVLSGEDDSTVAWYENDGNQAFTVHTIYPASANTLTMGVIAEDLDEDGDMDVLATVHRHSIVWFENDGNENFTQHTITTRAILASCVRTADVDGDGDLDVLSASARDSKIAWYENDGEENFTAHTITTEAFRAMSVAAADVDGDGDIDVLSASRDDNMIAWYENDGSESFTAHPISTSATGAYSVRAADVDGDGDIDVLSASEFDHKIRWYENKLNEMGSEDFSPHVISATVYTARSVYAADIDRDGDMDVLSAAYSGDQIAWYRNNGNQQFTPHTINSLADRANDVFVADVDSDGDLDVLSASNDGRIAWYEHVNRDFGDAPDPYPTTLADNGAFHEAIGPRLGASRDGEIEGQPSAGAVGDGADDDGVLFGTIPAGGTVAAVNIRLENATSAKVDAWIDFNRDGDWLDVGEKILDDVAANNPVQTFNYDLPPGLTAGDSFARVRLSSTGGLDSTGPAADGEVEDYLVRILAPPVVEDVLINDGDVQRSRVDSIQINFSQMVDVIFSSGDVFEVVNTDTNEVVQDFVVLDQSSGKTVANITFLPGPSVDGGGGLRDGSYRLTIDASRISRLGLPLDGDGNGDVGDNYIFGDQAADRFYRNYGDQNGNGIVDLLDFAAFRVSFGKSDGDADFRPELDGDSDGKIDLLDFAAFRQNFGS